MGRRSDGQEGSGRPSDHQAPLHRGTGFTYVTKKNRRNNPDRLVLKKYDPVIRKHVDFREER